MSLDVHRTYSMQPPAVITDTGDTDIADPPEGCQVLVHRLILTNENAAARTVTLKPTGGTPALPLSIEPYTTLDLDELQWDEAAPGEAAVLNISGSDVTAYVDFSFERAG